MLPSGADLAGAGGGASLASLLPQVADMVGKQSSALEKSISSRLGALSNSVDSAATAGMTSFQTLQASLMRFGTGLSSTLDGMWSVGSGAGAAGGSADGLAILGGGSSLLQQLGGGALSMFQGVGSKASSLLESGAEAVGNIGKNAGGAIGGAISMGATAIGAAVSLFAPEVSAALGIVSALGPLIGNLLGKLIDTLFAPLKFVLNALSSAFSAVTEVMGVLGETAMKALGAFGSAVMAATEAALKMAREVASIRNNTGRSLADSQRGYWGLRGAGFSGEGASSFLSGAGPAFVSGTRTRAWGLPDVTDPEFATKFATLFQKLESSGPSGYMKARAMANSISGGKASPELLQLAYTRPGTIAREQKWTQGVQKSLGVSPEAIRQFADEFPLFINRISTFVETVKVRFATHLLPFMQKALEGLTNFLARNADKIADAMKNGLIWVFTKLPPLLIQGAQIALNALVFMTNAMFNFSMSVLTSVEQLGKGKGFLYAVLSGIADAIDSLIGIFGKVKGAFTVFWMELENYIANNVILQFGFKRIFKRPAKAYSQEQIFQEGMKATHAFDPFSARKSFDKSLSTGELAKQAIAAQGMLLDGKKVADNIAQSIQGGINTASDIVGPGGSNLRAIFDSAPIGNGTATSSKEANSTMILQQAQAALKETAKARNGKDSGLNALVGQLDTLIKATNNVSRTVADTADCSQSSANGVLARLGSYVATDQFLQATR